MSTFTIQNPEIDFEVIDGGGLGTFDGLGDEVFDTFNTVVRGTFGEAGEFAEFDITGFSIPPGEVITNATFQVQLTSLLVGGLGVTFGENPQFLGIYGYLGNGIAEASDFQAGTLLTTFDISQASVGDILTFDVTDFVEDLVSDGASFVGLGVRAQDFGGLAIEESSTVGVPRLTITTTADTPTPVGTVQNGTSGKDTLIGNAGNDSLSGGNGNDTLYGNAGNDTLIGGNGSDLLFGSAGNDLLNGGNGTDTLRGGLGNDTLTGGNASDVFVFAPGDGTDTITDFQPGPDKIGLTGGLTLENLSFSGNQILYGNQVLAILTGVNTTTLTAANFVTV